LRRKTARRAAVHRRVAQLAQLVQLLPLQVADAVGDLGVQPDHVRVHREQRALLRRRLHLRERRPHEGREAAHHQQRQLRRDRRVELRLPERRGRLLLVDRRRLLRLVHRDQPPQRRHERAALLLAELAGERRLGRPPHHRAHLLDQLVVDLRRREVGRRSEVGQRRAVGGRGAHGWEGRAAARENRWTSEPRGRIRGCGGQQEHCDERCDACGSHAAS